jgi:hypothetical protein
MSELYADQIPMFSFLYVFVIAVFCFAKKKKKKVISQKVRCFTKTITNKSLIFLNHIYMVYFVVLQHLVWFFTCSSGAAFIMSQDAAHIAFTYSSHYFWQPNSDGKSKIKQNNLLMQSISICIYHRVFVMEMLHLHLRNIRTRIQIIGNISHMFVMAYSSVREQMQPCYIRQWPQQTQCAEWSDRCCTC